MSQDRVLETLGILMDL